MRAIIVARIEAEINDPDPEKRASWERIPRTDKIPWLHYAVGQLEKEARDDLMRWYTNF